MGHLLLQLQQPVHQRVGGRGAAGDVDVHRRSPVHALDDVVTIQPPGMWWMASAMEVRACEVLSLSARVWWYFSHSWRSLNSLHTGGGICGTGGFTSTRALPPDRRRASRAR